MLVSYYKDMCRRDVLQICRRYDVSEATSFLLEKLGEVQEAFDVLLKVCNNNNNILQHFFMYIYLTFVDIQGCITV